LSVIGNDLVEVERKYCDPYSIRLTTRILASTNVLPKFNDASTALAKRFMVLKFTKSFRGEGENPNLKTELLQELPGILNWALDGYKDLHESGKFVTPASSLELIKELAEASSPIGGWLEECCDIGPSHQIERKAAHQAYCVWAEENRVRDLPDAGDFSTLLRAALPNVDLDGGRKGGRKDAKDRRVWVGFALKSE
jgi:putative DNA primase/helicase